MWDKRIKNAERRFLLNLKRAARGEFGLGAVHDYLKQLDKARTRAAATDNIWDAGRHHFPLGKPAPSTSSRRFCSRMCPESW